MKEFSVDAFRDTIFESLLNSPLFPYMKEESVDRAKHPKREPLHLKEAIRSRPHKISNGNTSIFEVGDEMLELSHPYYHILQQAPVIRKANKGTKKSKGSQAEIADVRKRDYEKISWNGKTFTKEYSKNVRGMRKPSKNVMIFGNGFIMNRDANAYQNIHYKYIDTILDDIMPVVASEYGLKMKRKQKTDLIDDVATTMGVDISTILNALASFM